MKFQAMAQPIAIGPMTLKNRFAVPPMANNYANSDGTLSSRSLAYYRERAKGGFSLITIEATVVDPHAKGGPRKSCLFNDAQKEALKQVVDTCHAYGAKVSVQLQHAGRESSSSFTGYPIQAASPIAASPTKETPQEVSREEIYRIIELFGDAALRAKEAGADAVEVHCAHGYFISGFTSLYANKRVDEFGGSFENRMRLPRLIIENIRKKAGSDLALLCRINGGDMVPGGNDVHDNMAIACYLESLGIDGLDISMSVHSKDQYMWAPTTTHAGFNIGYVQEIKKCVSIPVITVGRHTEPFVAETFVRTGKADVVAFGRQSLADPHLPNKALEGKLNDLIPCIACLQGCVCNMFVGKPITCLANPFLGHEGEPLSPAATPKNIMVAGGGPGGLYAAWICALRGHKVTLYEKSSHLGGALRLGAVPPGKGDLANLVRSYIDHCTKAGVQMVMETEVSPALVAEKHPDEVILATGSQPFYPSIPGLKESGVVTATQVLAGEVTPGPKVLMVGGGMVGCETAEFLCEIGHQVSLIKRRNELAPDIIPEHRIYLLENLKEHGLQFTPGAAVEEFIPGGVRYTKNGEQQELSGFDTVVLAMGERPYNPLEQPLKEAGFSVHTIGDAAQVRKALDAIAEARELALTL